MFGGVARIALLGGNPDRTKFGARCAQLVKPKVCREAGSDFPTTRRNRSSCYRPASTLRQPAATQIFRRLARSWSGARANRRKPAHEPRKPASPNALHHSGFQSSSIFEPFVARFVTAIGSPKPQWYLTGRQVRGETERCPSARRHGPGAKPHRTAAMLRTAKAGLNRPVARSPSGVGVLTDFLKSNGVRERGPRCGRNLLNLCLRLQG